MITLIFCTPTYSTPNRCKKYLVSDIQEISKNLTLSLIFSTPNRQFKSLYLQHYIQEMSENLTLSRTKR